MIYTRPKFLSHGWIVAVGLHFVARALLAYLRYAKPVSRKSRTQPDKES